MNDSKVQAMMVICIILSLAVVAAFTSDYEASATRLKSFTSYDELKNFVSASTQYQGWYPYGGLRQTWNLGPTFMTAEDASTTQKHSTTNVQVEGVDEADIVKTDGTYIYVISKHNVIILKAYPPEEAQILSKLTFAGGIKGVFINEDRLAVFEDAGWLCYDYNKPMAEPPDYQSPRTFVRIYNIADRACPTSVRNVSIDGSYVSSRMIDDYIYVLAQQGVYIQTNQVAIPRITYSGTTVEIPATQIYYTNITDSFTNYVHVLAVNLLNDQQDPTSKSFLLGYASTMYVSLNNIYIAYPSYQNQIETTRIHRIHIDQGEIDYQATGEVPGYVLNQFSMDEYNSYFRIVTTTGDFWAMLEAASRSHAYILDMDLNTIGALEDLAPGEKIYSARFMGNRCYLVTFKKTDPLFVIDLAVPTDPQVLGQLKITGYSDYLHPYDENHIIGIGKETAEAEGGNFAWYQGVKISLFDVTDVAVPKEIAKYEIGDRGTDSPILTDHKAFLFDKDKNLLVIPVTVAEINETKYPNGVPDNMYGDFVYDGAYVFHISLEDRIQYRGRITHLEDNSDLLKSGYYYYSPYSVKRSLYIDDVLYTISELKIKMNSLVDLSELGEINLSA